MEGYSAAWIVFATFRLRQHHELTVVQHVRFMQQTLCQKHNPNCTPEAPLDYWQLVWNAHVLILTTACVDFELRPGLGDIYYIYIYIYICVCVCWIKFMMLWYIKTHKAHEKKNGRGPSVNRTFYLQTKCTCIDSNTGELLILNYTLGLTVIWG